MNNKIKMADVKNLVGSTNGNEVVCVTADGVEIREPLKGVSKEALDFIRKPYEAMERDHVSQADIEYVKTPLNMKERKEWANNVLNK